MMRAASPDGAPNDPTAFRAGFYGAFRGIVLHAWDAGFGREGELSVSHKSTGALGVSTPRILVASLVGTSVEFFDFYIYTTAASLVFGPLFFPAASPSAQLLSSYATFALAFIARPLGGWAFGHFGD